VNPTNGHLFSKKRYMKKMSFLAFMLMASTTFINAQIFVTHLTWGRPIGLTRYKGDYVNLGNTWFYQFEIGQESWNSSQVGIGQNTDGITGWNWADANWYQNGPFPNKRVQRDIGSFQFSAAGTWYVVGRAKAFAGDSWTYSEEGGWNNNTSVTLSTTAGNASYFTVAELGVPSSAIASPSSSTSTNLSWAKWNDKNVMIVRYRFPSYTSPVDGTTYSVGSTLGTTGVVVYSGNGTAFTDTGLTPGQQYFYLLYTENYGYYSAAVLAGENITLPVTFTSLSGSVRNGQAKLSWHIADEVNVDHYEVEESVDGRRFITFTQVDAASRSNYQATDAQLNMGPNYYRVKAVDIDGKLTYSKVLRLDYSAVDNNIRIYPNPSRGELNLGLNIGAGNYQIRVTNALGQTVFQQPLTHEGGSRSLPLALPKLNAGIYQVEVSGGVEKFVRSVRIE